MALGQSTYFYTVELSALEENLGLSMDRVARLREKAMRRNDTQATDQYQQAAASDRRRAATNRALEIARSNLTKSGPASDYKKPLRWTCIHQRKRTEYA